MFKNLHFLLLFLIGEGACSAQNVNLNDALTVANQLIVEKTVGSGTEILSHNNITSKSGTLLAYAFNLSSSGYIVVCADKDQIPVIAYSFVSAFGDNADFQNPLYNLIQVDLENRFNNKSLVSDEQIAKNQSQWNSILNHTKAKKAFDQWPAVGSTSTEGWLLTKWNQSAPYNAMCPMDLGSGSRSLTGCPSTAMSQIINYHQTLNNTRFADSDDYYHNYGSNQFMIDDDYVNYDFPSFPQLNLYLDTLEDKYNSKSSLTNKDMAALMFACGVATKTVYSSAGSGTFSVNQAYAGLLRFGFSASQLLDTSVANPYPQIIINIKDSLPVFLAVVDMAWNTGHNLVIDGYNTDDYYHLNFGWGGAYDGWYFVPSGLPYSLTVFEGIIVDIKNNPLMNIEANENRNKSIDLYPNPASAFTTFRFTPKENDLSVLRIFDCFGKMVWEQQITTELGKEEILRIDLRNFSQGIYTIIIANQSEKITGKLIKL